MSQLKPAAPGLVAKLAAALITISGLLTLASQWQAVRDYLFPQGQILTWSFFMISLAGTSLLVWIVMNHLWHIEFQKHRETALKLENLRQRFECTEHERLADVITGIANEKKFISDVLDFYQHRRTASAAQVILIDLRGFREVNKKFGFTKGDELLRHIAQTLHTSMRRNEEIYKRTLDARQTRPLWKRIYRKYPGGDEFLFLIEGQQWDAIGFIANRLIPQFQEFSKETKAILGAPLKLSFQCAIAPLIKGDLFEDVFTRVQDCYMRAAELEGDFTISWFPTDVEQTLPSTDYRRAWYEKVRKVFNVGKPSLSP